MSAGPKITLDPSARLPFASPVVLSNIASEHGEAPASIDYQVNHAPAVEIGGRTFEGPLSVLRALTEHYAKVGLSGSKEDAAAVDAFLAQADTLGSAPFPVAQQSADDLDQHLALRTFLVGHEVTAADVAIWGAIRSSSPMLGIVKKLAHTHLARWYAHVDSLPAFTNAINAFHEAKSSMFKQKKTAAGFDLFLKGAKDGSVVTRFPPEPSGYLHVGHAKAAILNEYFARQYKGKLIVRFDDTNPSKEKQEFEDAIVEDLALLGIKPDQVTHTSDYFEKLHELAVQLIKEGKAYADDTPQEEMRAQRMDGLPSARRDASVEDNLKRFEEMNTGSAEGARWCIRAKMSVDNPNKAMRDPVIYRCNGEIPHARTGNTWKAYPTYDFACPVVDSLEGITHALRSNEYHDRNPQYAWMLEALGLRSVEIWDFGRMNFVYTLLSKRKLSWFVENGHVSGWDDPRFPTIRGIRRRGMTIDTIRQFILSQGPSQQIINMEWDNIWALNKRLIDPVVPRYTALEEAGLVPATISGVTLEEKQMPCHKKNAELGTKTTVFGPDILFEQADAAAFEEGEEVTLMDWGNAYIRKKHVGSNGVERLELEAHLDGDFKQTKKKVTWIAAESAENRLTPVTLLDFDYLITKKKLEEEDKFTDFLTPQSIFTTQAVADKNVAALPKGTQIQFERKGYYVLDDDQSADGRRVFIRIPDGKAASSASKAAPDENPEQKKAAAAAARAQKAAEKAKKAEEKQAKKAKKAAGGAGGAAGAAGAEGANAAPAKLSATAQLVDEGVKRINMYSVPKVNEDIEVPVQTKMYHVKPISE
ncbi:glutamate--tRNA ligase [Malassezia cuniculi]|uniref:glutamate--tRNA ligase n=1 Tax=Malassezia cuniculi TaxID=948313 RepID=A0AAF0J642_9BASI|nr:glutamate--tRNA ligase [Malassezia cuniculi]